MASPDASRSSSAGTCSRENRTPRARAFPCDRDPCSTPPGSCPGAAPAQRLEAARPDAGASCSPRPRSGSAGCRRRHSGRTGCPDGASPATGPARSAGTGSRARETAGDLGACRPFSDARPVARASGPSASAPPTGAPSARRSASDVPGVLRHLRGVVPEALGRIPAPLGFHPRRRCAAGRVRRQQQQAGADPPTTRGKARALTPTSDADPR